MTLSINETQCNDIKHNDTQYNDIQHNVTQHSDIKNDTRHKVPIYKTQHKNTVSSAIMLNVPFIVLPNVNNVDFHDAECRSGYNYRKLLGCCMILQGWLEEIMSKRKKIILIKTEIRYCKVISSNLSLGACPRVLFKIVIYGFS